MSSKRYALTKSEILILSNQPKLPLPLFLLSVPRKNQGKDMEGEWGICLEQIWKHRDQPGSHRMPIPPWGRKPAAAAACGRTGTRGWSSRSTLEIMCLPKEPLRSAATCGRI